jgi:hypothetical protein
MSKVPFSKLGLRPSSRLIIYQTLNDYSKEPIYHPTMVGAQFLACIGFVA